MSNTPFPRGLHRSKGNRGTCKNLTSHHPTAPTRVTPAGCMPPGRWEMGVGEGEAHSNGRMTRHDGDAMTRVKNSEKTLASTGWRLLERVALQLTKQKQEHHHVHTQHAKTLWKKKHNNPFSWFHPSARSRTRSPIDRSPVKKSSAIDPTPLFRPGGVGGA